MTYESVQPWHICSFGLCIFRLLNDTIWETSDRITIFYLNIIQLSILQQRRHTFIYFQVKPYYIFYLRSVATHGHSTSRAKKIEANQLYMRNTYFVSDSQEKKSENLFSKKIPISFLTDSSLTLFPFFEKKIEFISVFKSFGNISN